MKARLKPAHIAAAHVALATSVSIGAGNGVKPRRDQVSELASLSRCLASPLSTSAQKQAEQKLLCHCVCFVNVWVSCFSLVRLTSSQTEPWSKCLRIHVPIKATLGTELCYNRPHKDLRSWNRETQNQNKSANKCSSQTKRSIM